MSISAIITSGYGSFGSVPLVVLDGYSIGAAVVPPAVVSTGGGGGRGTYNEDRKYYERQARRKAALAAKLSKPKKRAALKKAIAAVPEEEKLSWTKSAEAKLIASLMKDQKAFEKVMFKYYEMLEQEIEEIGRAKLLRHQQDEEAIAAILLAPW